MREQAWQISFASIAHSQALLQACVLLLSLTLSPAAFADSGFDSCASSPNDPHCRFSQDTPAGPLSQAAGERARRGQTEIEGLNSSGASAIQASSLGVCGTAKCTPAQKAAAIANATATRTAATAASRMTQELSARQEIVKQVESGVGSRYSAAEASAFHQMFQGKTPPSKEQIDSLHPELRDPATAMRTSIGAENYLANTLEKNRDVARKTGELLAKNEKLLDRAKSFSESGFVKQESGSRSEESGIAGKKAQENLPVAKSKFSSRSKRESGSEEIGKLGTPGKELLPVSDEDKTLIGQLIVGLREGLELDKSAETDPKVKTGAEAGPSATAAGGGAGESTGNRGLASIAGQEAGLDKGQSGMEGQVKAALSAGGTGLDGNGIAADLAMGNADMSIFERVHLRIASRALKDGLIEPRQRK